MSISLSATQTASMHYFIDKNKLRVLIKQLLADAAVVAPFAEFGQFHLEEVKAENICQIAYQGYRAVEPLKSYFFKLIEKVAQYFGKNENPHAKKLVIIGARDCDLSALAVLDRVFLEGEFKDPFYAANRQAILVISTDCTAGGKTCFCSMLNGQPYPVHFFDLNLSPLDDGFVVEIGSEKGRRFFENNQNLFMGADETRLKARDQKRQAVVAWLAESNKGFKLKLPISKLHKINLENKAWKNLTKDCVECSGCNFICPTCTCFLLLDGGNQATGSYSRHKVWDACLKDGYARVAGGANPRPQLYRRLQNRYHCKFDYSNDRLGRYTCVGCGRCCVDGCAGKIDMRRVIKELEQDG